jgi:hypothetical protein
MVPTSNTSSESQDMSWQPALSFYNNAVLPLDRIAELSKGTEIQA